MLDITSELNEFITVLYGRQPTMNTTWVQLYGDACDRITKDVFRLYVSAARAGTPCDQTHVMAFLIYEERLHINNAKFIRPVQQEQAMRLLQVSALIRTKIQECYNMRKAGKEQARDGRL